jgi:hypothetical protein
MPQREEQQPASALTWVALQKMRSGGGMFSGGTWLDFERGWALLPFHGERTHYLVKEGGTVSAACGLVWDLAPKAPLFAPGNFPRCMRCSSALRRCA